MPVEMALKIALKMGEVDPEKLQPEDLLPYLTHVTHVDVPMFLRMLQAAGAHSAEDMLGQIDVPTLVVAGGRDTFTPPALAEAMAKAIPGADLFVVERGSHVAPIEQPDVINARIRTFLEERVL
jgi:pimeloyl-ACP methyl ester carboxylesterase